LKKIILDTETTGFQPGNICQLSYIILTPYSTRAKNYFFQVDFVEEGAEKAHGFSVQRLKELSGGKRFADFQEEIRRDLSGGILICHNVDFDSRFLDAEFSRLTKGVSFVDSFCSMEYFTDILKLPGRYESYKWPRLSELMSFLSIDTKVCLEKAKELYKSEDISFHDSRFDTAGLYLSLLFAKERYKPIKELLIS
jgi:DNA polymerase III subunit epsilon